MVNIPVPEEEELLVVQVKKKSGIIFTFRSRSHVLYNCSVFFLNWRMTYKSVSDTESIDQP